MVEQATGQFEQAWNLFKQAVQLNPENGRALYGIIELGYHFSRFDDIEQALNAYLECHPGDINYLYALAGCFFRQGRMVEAQQEIEKVILLDPQNANANEMIKLIEERRYAGPVIESQMQQIRS
jgi:tetratricopeptide (TPR) repeat protein